MNTDEKLDLLIDKVNSMDDQFDAINKRLDGVDKRLDGVDKNLEVVNKRLDNLESDVREINLRLENEIAPNIMRVAEGHLDLDRKLKEVIKTNTDYEMLVLKYNQLDTRVRKLEMKEAVNV